MSKIALFAFIAIASCVLVYFSVNKKTNISQTPLPYASAYPSPTPPAKLSELRAGGSSFADPKGVFVVLYPNDYKIDSQNDSLYTRLSKIGPTQRGQTEIYDGVIIVFESIDLEGKTLGDFVNGRMQSTTADGTTEIIESQKSISMNNYPGFSYKVRGLGTFDYLVLQKDTSSNFAVSITISVNDPEQKGFQDDVDAILASLELLK